MFNIKNFYEERPNNTMYAKDQEWSLAYYVYLKNS